MPFNPFVFNEIKPDSGDQCLYWHRKARAIRAMLREAVAGAVQQQQQKKKQGTSFASAMERLIGVASQPRTIDVNDVLNLIFSHTDDCGKDLIRLIKNGNYFERICTIHYETEVSGRPNFLSRFRDAHQRHKFQEHLQEGVRASFEDYLAKMQGGKVSLLQPELTDKVLDLLANPKIVICDCPKPSYGSKDMLRFIPEPERLHKNYAIRASTGERVSEVWHEVFFRLMNFTAKGRIYCHPDARDSLMAALGPEGIKECVKRVVDA